ncbi:class E sortase [Agromyces sp. NPDC056523]|uniref:class E sortase n=1 Tax=Agromyces sp. NPDC056523 TaxID=3345850 RepID=UPI00366DE7B8
MPGGEPDAPHAREAATRAGASRSRDGRSGRRRVGIAGVLGELLVIAGALIALYLGWKLWWNDAIMASQQSAAASDRSLDWLADGRRAPSPVPSEGAAPVDPVVDDTDHADAEAFAVMYVPRFGADSQRTIAEGVGLDVLNSHDLGVGHHPGTQMPGETGNFATEVLAAVPHHPGLEPTDRIITLTSCNPLYSTTERIIAYGVLESWQPAAAGPPAEIAADVAAWED